VEDLVVVAAGLVGPVVGALEGVLVLEVGEHLLVGAAPRIIVGVAVVLLDGALKHEVVPLPERVLHALLGALGGGLKDVLSQHLEVQLVRLRLLGLLVQTQTLVQKLLQVVDVVAHDLYRLVCLLLSLLLLTLRTPLLRFFPFLKVVVFLIFHLDIHKLIMVILSDLVLLNLILSGDEVHIYLTDAGLFGSVDVLVTPLVRVGRREEAQTRFPQFLLQETALPLRPLYIVYLFFEFINLFLHDFEGCYLVHRHFSLHILVLLPLHLRLAYLGLLRFRLYHSVHSSVQLRDIYMAQVIIYLQMQVFRKVIDVS